MARRMCSKHYHRVRRYGSPLVTTNSCGMVRLDAGPLVRAVERVGPPFRLLDDRDRRGFVRAKSRGWVNDHMAERILAAAGLTLDEVYGPAWDEVAA